MVVGPITSSTTGAFLISTHNTVPQNLTESGRTGRTILITSLQVRGTIQLSTDPTIGNLDQRVRIIFFIDSQTNGEAATLDEIINTSGTVDIDSFRDLANIQRFRVIYDRVFDLPVQGVAQDSATTFESIPISKGFQFSRKLNLKIQYDDGVTTGAISTQRSNNIGAFSVCEAGQKAPTVVYTSRIRYTDA